MLVYKNKEFRNLQEQVYKNMKDIQDMMQGINVLAEFGIKVVGQVDSAIELPDPATYEGEYGDAYVVGTEEPYEYYIFTRAFEGQENPSWFDLGVFPMPGPQGEQGEQGPAGPQGPTGPSGADGADAGFGTVSAEATTLDAGEDATVSVTTSGPDTAMNISFSFGIPKGQDGDVGTVEWGEIGGDITDQEDLVTALQGKQNASNAVTTDGTQTITGNKTLTGSTSFGSGGAISISGTGINVYTPAAIRTYGADVNLGGSLVLGSSKIKSGSSDSYGLVIPSTTSLTADKTIATTDQIPVVSYPVTDVEVDGVSVLSGTVAEITMPDLSDYVTSTELSTELADYTPTANLASVATSGDYDDLSNKPTIPAAVSGTNDGTNWTSLTIGADTYGLASGSGTVTDVEVDGVSVVDQDGVAEITMPDLSGYAETADLGDCAYLDEDELSIAYSQLTGTPSIPAQTSDLTNDSGFIDKSVNDLTNYSLTSSFASVAFSGDYDDLIDTPTIPTDTSDLTNGAGFITSSALSSYVTTTDLQTELAGYATTSDISDMATETWVGNQGYLTSVSWSDISSKPTFATVATSGSYTDLTDKPTIPVVDYPVTDVQVDGVSVVSSKVASITLPTMTLSETAAVSPDYTLASITIGGDVWNVPSGGSSTDVQINGTSIVSGGVADIATESTYNATTNPIATMADIPSLSNYVDLTSAQTISGNKIFTGLVNVNNSGTLQSGIAVIGSDGSTVYKKGSIMNSIRGTSHTITLPSTGGTLALTSQIPSVSGYAKTYVGYQETQTFTGNNTFNISQVEPSDNYFETQQIKIVDTTSNQNRTLFEAISSFPQDGSYVNIDSDATTVGGDNTYIRGEDYLCIETDTTTGQIEVSSNAISIYANSLTYNNNQVATVNQIPSVPVTDVEVDNVSIVSSGIAELTSETWTFTLSDGTTTTKKILVG